MELTWRDKRRIQVWWHIRFSVSIQKPFSTFLPCAISFCLPFCFCIEYVSTTGILCTLSNNYVENYLKQTLLMIDDMRDFRDWIRSFVNPLSRRSSNPSWIKVHWFSSVWMLQYFVLFIWGGIHTFFYLHYLFGQLMQIVVWRFLLLKLAWNAVHLHSPLALIWL